MKSDDAGDASPGRPSPPFPVAGIGASAGGLRAIEELFANLAPNIEMAFIVVQHSDPKHETLLPQILSRRTKFDVVTAIEGRELKPGCVYVCPSDAHLKIEGGRIRLAGRRDSPEVSLTIGWLFRSLAAEYEDRA